MLPQVNSFHHNSYSAAPRVDIETLVETKLPPSPDGIVRITNVLRDYNASTAKIAEAINYEPALVTRILRLANSPLYALEKTVATIQQAVAAVGTMAVSDLVMMEMTSVTFSRAIFRSARVKQIWRHSIAVGLMSREISRVLNNRGTEEAFICGLLHDVGKIILLSHDEQAYDELTNESSEGDMLRMEVNRFGYNHAEVGALVARRWGLPEEVCYSILTHHDPSQAAKQMVVTYIVDVADLAANTHSSGLRTEDISRLNSSESFIRLGLTEVQFEDAWAAAEISLVEVEKAFA